MLHEYHVTYTIWYYLQFHKTTVGLRTYYHGYGGTTAYNFIFNYVKNKKIGRMKGIKDLTKNMWSQWKAFPFPALFSGCNIYTKYYFNIWGSLGLESIQRCTYQDTQHSMLDMPLTIDCETLEVRQSGMRVSSFLSGMACRFSHTISIFIFFLFLRACIMEHKCR
jgi:hypothetical protein